MIRTLWIAATGMQAQTLNLDVISNNLANVTTSGFKKSRADFQDLLYETIKPAGATSAEGNEVPTGIQLGHGVKPAAVQKIFVQGDFQYSQNPLDIAIEGDGFFQITMPDGSVAYTRAGTFKINSDGTIVTSDGYSMQPQIDVPADALSITIGNDGTVSVIRQGDTDSTEIGNIELARFINPSGLYAMGKNLFIESSASGAPILGTPGLDGFGTLAQGFLEMSNVKVVDEMVNMITAQRAYEANSKAIQTADEMLQIANNVKR